MPAGRQSDYIRLARQRATALWQAYLDLRSMQAEWDALDYTRTLADGDGANAGYTAAAVKAVVFDTSDALRKLLTTGGHAANITNLL